MHRRLFAMTTGWDAALLVAGFGIAFAVPNFARATPLLTTCTDCDGDQVCDNVLVLES